MTDVLDGTWHYGEWGYGSWLHTYGRERTKPGFGIDANPDGTWDTLVCDVRSFTIERGRSDYLDGIGAAQLSMEAANFSGALSAWNPNGLWAKQGRFVASTPLRVTVTWDQTYVLGTFLMDSITESWPGTVDSLASIRGTDGFKLLARHNGLERPPVGDGELSGARVNRLLDDAGWTGPRLVDAGLVHLMATNLSGVTADQLRLCGEAEWGLFYVTRDGEARFFQRDYYLNEPRMVTTQWTFVDSHDTVVGVGGQFGSAFTGAYVKGVDEPTVCYSDLGLITDDSRIVNAASLTPPAPVVPAGAPSQPLPYDTQTAVDQPSIDWYGRRTYTRTDLPIASANEALANAQAVVLYYADDARRVETLTFDALRDIDSIRCACDIRMNDRIRVLRMPGTSHAIDAELIVQGIHHDVVAGGADYQPASWMVTLYTAPAVFIARFGYYDADTGVPPGAPGTETAGYDVSEYAL